VRDGEIFETALSTSASQCKKCSEGLDHQLKRFARLFAAEIDDQMSSVSGSIMNIGCYRAHKSNAYSPYRMMGRFDLSILPCDLEDIRQSGRDMRDQGWK